MASRREDAQAKYHLAFLWEPYWCEVNEVITPAICIRLVDADGLSAQSSLSNNVTIELSIVDECMETIEVDDEGRSPLVGTRKVTLKRSVALFDDIAVRDPQFVESREFYFAAVATGSFSGVCTMKCPFRLLSPGERPSSCKFCDVPLNVTDIPTSVCTNCSALATFVSHLQNSNTEEKRRDALIQSYLKNTIFADPTGGPSTVAQGNFSSMSQALPTPTLSNTAANATTVIASVFEQPLSLL
mmetsp:Transcript_9692/g.29455  ORF Transcript_9692/g.29455 Transcript_9692/m.29455 type:complete len:243 (-) Transcript_9692:624-1352(-)